MIEFLLNFRQRSTITIRVFRDNCWNLAIHNVGQAGSVKSRRGNRRIREVSH